MSKITTFEQAKEVSIEKWKHIFHEILEVNELGLSMCGFCIYSIHLELEKGLDELYENCPLCSVEDACNNLVAKEFKLKVGELIEVINKIIDFLKEVKEGE